MLTLKTCVLVHSWWKYSFSLLQFCYLKTAPYWKIWQWKKYNCKTLWYLYYVFLSLVGQNKCSWPRPDPTNKIAALITQRLFSHLTCKNICSAHQSALTWARRKFTIIFSLRQRIDRASDNFAPLLSFEANNDRTQ